MIQENPAVTADLVDRMVSAITADGKWVDQIHLARTGGAYFDHHGAAPPDADALVLETHAFEYRAAAAKYDIDGVTERIQFYAEKLGVEVASGSIDERILGNALLNEYARQCEESVAHLRKLSGSPAKAETNTASMIEALHRFLEVATERLANIGSPGHDNPTNAEPTPISEILIFAEKLAEAKAKDDEWTDDTQEEAKSIAHLLVKFLTQEEKLLHLSQIRQKHLSNFVDFLRTDIYKYYGRSPADEDRSIEELRADALLTRMKKLEGVLTEIPKERGLCRLTRNKYLTFVGQFFQKGAARGIRLHPEVNLALLRGAKMKVRARNARKKLGLEAFKPVFSAPHYANVLAWNKLDENGVEGGKLVFHCALYWGPILLYHTGLRREELCGAMLDDVVTDYGSIPFLHIELNEQRRIKNDQSIRDIPLHPELIRLGFLDYVKKLKELGHTLLFPDLFSPSSEQPLGNRFYKQFKPILVQHGITDEGLAHPVRHLFGAQQKKKGTTEEERADLLGHGGSSETSERYCEPSEIEALYDLVLKMPVITANIEARPINLLPWVKAKEVAPFSRPSRSKAQRKPSRYL